MVVGYFNVVGVVGGVPNEANPVTLVDADTVLPGPVTGKDFKMVTRRIAEGVEIRGGVYALELVEGTMRNVGRDFVPPVFP